MPRPGLLLLAIYCSASRFVQPTNPGADLHLHINGQDLSSLHHNGCSSVRGTGRSRQCLYALKVSLCEILIPQSGCTDLGFRGASGKLNCPTIFSRERLDLLRKAIGWNTCCTGSCNSAANETEFQKLSKSNQGAKSWKILVACTSTKTPAVSYTFLANDLLIYKLTRQRDRFA
jgi:hypothetical protein